MSVTIKYPSCEGFVAPGESSAIRALISPRLLQIPVKATAKITRPDGSIVWQGSAAADSRHNVSIPLVFKRVPGNYHVIVEFFGTLGSSLGKAEHDFYIKAVSGVG